MSTAPGSLVEAWLRDYAGLDAGSLGPGVVARAVAARIDQLGCGGEPAYLDRLVASAAERQRLIDRVVVAETWFFRDRVALDAVARHAVETWGPAHPGSVFRVLCVPCATGEESYSLAMAFALAGWPADRLLVEALDIGEQNIARAREGIYRKNSFRGEDLSFRDPFFEAVGEEAWRVNERVRAPVAFAVANLLAPDFVFGRGFYDAIFCRNLLIYFDRPVQDRVVATLGALLAPEGLFAVGPAEPVLLFEHGYGALKIANGFLLRREPPRPRPAPVVPPPARPAPAPVRLPAARALPAPVVQKLLVSPAPPPPDTVASIQALADAGKLREASERGAALLAGGAATPGLLYLLGVVADAGGDAVRAEAFYRKTLYLDPQHRAALAQLALHAEGRGEARQAEALRARLLRAESVSSSREDPEAVR